MLDDNIFDFGGNLPYIEEKWKTRTVSESEIE